MRSSKVREDHLGRPPELGLTIPPPIMTSEPGSFAHHTMTVRIPHIIDETVQLNSYPPEIERSLQDLRLEILSGLIRPLQEVAPDRRRWALLSRPHIARPWLDVPWYWAEAFFYRRVLEATHYFQPGPWHRRDPFAPKKHPELAPDAAPRDVDALLAAAPLDTSGRFIALLHASLWGNRLDLSHDVSMTLGRGEPDSDDAANLLLDDTTSIQRYLSSRKPGRVSIIADNAGGEVLADLALSDFLLDSRLAGRVDLHVKAYPFFVSDATMQDVQEALDALAVGGQRAAALTRRLKSHIDEGRLVIATHWFYTSPLYFRELPRDLFARYHRAALVILKGDANYRRLLSDAHWPPTAPFSQITGYFPAPLVALRTLKAEIIVGLAPGRAERLAAEDREWLVNGRRGVIQARLPN